MLTGIKKSWSRRGLRQKWAIPPPFSPPVLYWRVEGQGWIPADKPRFKPRFKPRDGQWLHDRGGIRGAQACPGRRDRRDRRGGCVAAGDPAGALAAVRQGRLPVQGRPAP